jgi:hypothetical protein
MLIGLSCGYAIKWRMAEKYSVDLSHPEAVQLVDENIWEAATVLDRGTDGTWNAYLKEPASPSRLEKSGPKWGGDAASQGRSRAAVYSWSGTVRDPIGPPPYEGSVADSIGGLFFPWTQPRYEGRYWTDIYDVESATRLVQIRGDFRRESPDNFQGKARWFASRFYLMPLEPNTLFHVPLKRDGMRRLLICDIDSAAKAKGVAESDAPVPLDRAKPYFQHSRSDYQMRFLRLETPQAHIAGFQDEPVFVQGTGDIERVNVTAMLDVKVPGRYSLELDLAGIKERAESDLRVGSTQLTVPFPIARLRQLGVGGPYRIRWARLLRLADDGQIEAQNSFDRELAVGLSPSLTLIDASTQAYSLSALGSLLHFTGENSATLIPGVGAQPGRLEVRIGIYSPESHCRGYGDLARAQRSGDGSVTDSPVGRALVLNFTGKGAAEPGPYHIEQVGVQCGDSFIQGRNIEIPAK